MFENELQTRCAICGSGILLGLIVVLARLPLFLLILPVAVLFLGFVADPEETHAVWYGMLNASRDLRSLRADGNRTIELCGEAALLLVR